MSTLRVLLMIMLCWVGTTQATLLNLARELKEVNLIHVAEYLEDSRGQWTLDDVKHRTSEFQPWHQGGSEMNFGFTQSAYWIRVPLQRSNDAAPTWLLELSYTKLRELDVYQPNGTSVQTGNGRAFNTRAFFDRSFIFPIQIDTRADYYYIRVTSQYALTVPLKVWSIDAFQEQQQQFHSLQFMYFGALLLLAMYGLAMYVSLHDAKFWVYSVYITTTGMGVFAGNGYGRLWLWPDSPIFDELAQCQFFSLAAFFAAQFARMILPTRDSKWTNLSLQVSQYLFLAVWSMTLLYLIFPSVLIWANQLLMLNAIYMGWMVSLVGIKAYRIHKEGIRFFVIAWLILWLGISVGALRGFGLIPSNPVTSYAVQLSTIFEMILMAMALAEMLRVEYNSMSTYQQEALRSKEALLSITLQSEDRLKQAVHDRTEQLRASLESEKSLREQYVRFGSMISHEFRTPLNIIQSQTSLMKKEHENGLNEIPTRLQAINSATQRLKLMFEKWLSSDAISNSLEKMKFDAIDLNAWLRNMVEHNQHLFLEHPVELRLSPQVTDVRADEYHLGVALTNLIDNATKYSAQDSVIVIDTRFDPILNRVVISVEDQGIGVSADQQSKIFDEFHRVNPESSVDGVGLGLSIVKRIAHAHGGGVELRSRLGHGSTVGIWLPANEYWSKA